MSTERISSINGRLNDIAPLNINNKLNGVDFDVIGISSLKFNPVPEQSNMLSKMIQLYTKDVTNPDKPILINEKFEVTPGNFSPTKLNNSGGNRWVYAFGASGFGMKFHFPYGDNKNKVYITFCTRNAEYVDGWMDYTTNVSEEWVSAAISFFSKVPANTIPANTAPANTLRDFTAASFNKFNKVILWANFRGLGPSSVAEGSHGKISFSMQFVTEQAVVEEGGTVSAVTLGKTNPGTLNLSETVGETLTQLNNLTSPTVTYPTK